MRLRVLARDELVEAALALVLVEEREVVLVELAEELVPGDLLEALLRLAEVDPQDAWVATVAGVAHGRRVAAASLRPPADLVVVRRRLAFGHSASFPQHNG